MVNSHKRNPNQPNSEVPHTLVKEKLKESPKQKATKTRKRKIVGQIQMHKARKMCLRFGKCRLSNFHVNPGFSGKLFTVEQREKMLDLAAKNREKLMSFRAKSKDKGVTHESSETNRSVCTTHERNETEGNTKTSSQLLAME